MASLAMTNKELAMTNKKPVIANRDSGAAIS
jgi:hypothetical protein